MKHLTSKSLYFLLAAIGLCSTVPQAMAQYSGSPVPGKLQSRVKTNPYSSEAPAPGKFVQPTTKQRVNTTRIQTNTSSSNKVSIESLYKKLPLTVDDAKARMNELDTQLKLVDGTNAKQQLMVKNQIYSLSEWLQDVANAHWKMYKAFDKSQATKPQAKSEREIALSFSRLKNRAKLLKAELFIKQKRYPEALQPLVDIVVAEPTSETGKKAYKKLVDLGFSKELKSVEIAQKKGKSAAIKQK